MFTQHVSSIVVVTDDSILDGDDRYAQSDNQADVCRSGDAESLHVTHQRVDSVLQFDLRGDATNVTEDQLSKDPIAYGGMAPICDEGEGMSGQETLDRVTAAGERSEA